MEQKLQRLLDAIYNLEDEATKTIPENYAEIRDKGFEVFRAFMKVMQETDCWFEKDNVTKIITR